MWNSRVSLTLQGIIMIWFLLGVAFSITFAAGYVFGYRNGIKRGQVTGTVKVLKQMDKAVFDIVKNVADDINFRWGKFLGFSDTEIEQAKKEAIKNYEKDLN